VVPARRFVKLPPTFDGLVPNADGTGLVLRRTRCDTLAQVQAQVQSQVRILPVDDDGTFEYAVPHDELITALSGVPMLWRTGSGGRLQAALDLVRGFGRRRSP
jgi:hypothetical protein